MAQKLFEAFLDISLSNRGQKTDTPSRLFHDSVCYLNIGGDFESFKFQNGNKKRGVKEEVLPPNTAETPPPPSSSLSLLHCRAPPPPHLNLHRLYLLKAPLLKKIHAIVISSAFILSTTSTLWLKFSASKLGARCLPSTCRSSPLVPRSCSTVPRSLAALPSRVYSSLLLSNKTHSRFFSTPSRPLYDAMNTNTTPSPSPGPAAKISASPKPNASAAAGTKRKRSAPGKFYAVKAGYQPGIYYEWSDCLTQVTGYKGAVCKCREIRLPS